MQSVFYRYYIGKNSTPEACKESLKGDKMKEEVFNRFAQHLENNGINIEKTQTTLGPLLNFDPDKEQFTGDHSEQANKLVKGDYREGFRIPESV